MLIRHEREKLIQAVVFFAKNTNFCGKTKLFKLLYFLDFEHYKVTGRSVTGLIYNAWKMGPVPTKLFEEIESPEPDLARAIEVSPIPTAKKPMLRIEPTQDFDPTHFTKRELKLLDKLANEYRHIQSEDMIEATHLENQPWDQVYNQENRKQAEIPYTYALRKDEYEEMMQLISEREQLLEALHK